MGRISWILVGMLALLPPAHAPSFDCAKAATRVEEMICSDAELSKLDNDLSVVYKSALAVDKMAARVRYDQKIWIQARNDCQDASCVKREYETRLSILKQVAPGLESSGGASSDTMFFGSWQGAGEADMSIIGYMHISATRLSWDGSKYSPACNTTYTALERKTGQGHYPDEPQPNSLIPDTTTFSTIKLRLGDAPCLDKVAYMLLVIRPSFPYHLNAVAYNASGKVIGTYSFGRFP